MIADLVTNRNQRSRTNHDLVNLKVIVEAMPVELSVHDGGGEEEAAST